MTLWQKISVAFCSPSPWVMSVDVGVRDTFVKLVEAVIFRDGVDYRARARCRGWGLARRLSAFLTGTEAK